LDQPSVRRHRFSRTSVAWAVLGLAGLLVLIQAVPYGRDRAPRPVTNPFKWQDAGGEAIARAACYDCHSNQTHYWWAVKVAPFSWLAQSDIQEGRSRLNFSTWDGRLTPQRLDRALHRGMPPIQYTIAHPEARLSEAQKQVLLASFRNSLPLNGAQPRTAPLVRVSDPGSESDRILQANCTSCHSSRKPLAYRTSDPARAQALLDRMKRRGARLTPAMERILVERFTR
jgi:mono/diheme cytochrome c family protein